MRIDIKPLSVNQAWQGKRFKTPAYKAYERDVLLLLKPMAIPDGDLAIEITYGFSNRQSDVDNPTKLFIDVLQKKYGFNDSRVTQLSMSKQKVDKGFEFIDFEIRTADEDRDNP